MFVASLQPVKEFMLAKGEWSLLKTDYFTESHDCHNLLELLARKETVVLAGGWAWRRVAFRNDISVVASQRQIPKEPY
jgi:hypothetical protein